jgi:futalosine hydrolase
MSCLVIAPTAKEIAPFIEYMGSSAGKIPIEVLITGVGSVNTTYRLVKQLSIKRPAMMIQVGVGGCFDRTLTLGTVVVVLEEAFGDLGVVEKGKLRSVFDLGLEAADQFPFTRGKLKNPHTSLLKKSRLEGVKGITVNQVTTLKGMNRSLKEKFDPVIETLEGAAFHYVAILEKIPFLQLRAVSN